MLRKSLALALAGLLLAGAVFAEEVDAIFKKFADGKVTALVKVKQKNKDTGKEEEVEKEMTYELYPKAKIKIGKKNEQAATEFLKSAKSGLPVKLYIDEKIVTEISLERKKK